jgi:predicted porin
MQKKLIVLAIAAMASGSAFADSTVTVYGVADAAIANVKGDGLQGGTVAVNGGLAASRLGVKASEDLDGGLKAIATYEINIDPETNTGFAGTARQALVGLTGGFGTAVTGYLQTTGWAFGGSYNVVGGSALSPLGNITKGQGFLIGDQATLNRAQRAVAYISPDLGGLKIAVNYSTAFAGTGDVNVASVSAGSLTTGTLVSADYTAGPLALGVVYAGTNNDDITKNVTEYAVGGSFNLEGVAKFTATYQTSKAANANVNGSAAVAAVPFTVDLAKGVFKGGTIGVDAVAANPNATSSNTVYSVGAAIPVEGLGTVALSYAGSTINTISPTATVGKNTKGYAIAFLKPLSKTLTAYAGYSAMQQDAGTAGNVTIANNLLTTQGGTDGKTAAGGASSILAIGLQKKF